MVTDDLRLVSDLEDVVESEEEEEVVVTESCIKVSVLVRIFVGISVADITV